MDILETVESFLAKKGTIYEPAFESGDVNFAARIGSDPVKMKISLVDEKILCFRSLLPIKLNNKKVNELFVAVNAINSYIKFGKFVVTGNGIHFELSRHCGKEKLKDKDIAYYLSASKKTVKDYLAQLADINAGKLKLKELMDTLIVPELPSSEPPTDDAPQTI